MTILMKKISSQEILQVLGNLVAETLPANLEGNLSLVYDDDGNVDVYFIEDNKEIPS